MRHLTTFVLVFLLFLISCKEKSNQTNIQIIKKDSSVKVVLKPSMPTTDSGKLMLHLDSLPKIKFPYQSEWYNRSFPSIDLSDFKEKKLFNLSYKLIPTQIGGGLLDDDRIDSTFNLTDEHYKAQWNLIEKTPKFIVLEVGNHFVTLTYQFKLIDAINSAIADPSGNSHFSANRHSTIYKDLKIVLHHEYSVQADEKGNFDTQTEFEKWFIDKNGYFKKR